MRPAPLHTSVTSLSHRSSQIAASFLTHSVPLNTMSLGNKKCFDVHTKARQASRSNKLYETCTILLHYFLIFSLCLRDAVLELFLKCDLFVQKSECSRCDL